MAPVCHQQPKESVKLTVGTGTSPAKTVMTSSKLVPKTVNLILETLLCLNKVRLLGQ